MPEFTRTRVCILTSAHSALDPRIFHKQAKSLARAGYAVTLVAPHPAQETLDGVRIRGVPRARTRPQRMLLTTARVLWRAALERADVYHLHDPELLLAGLLLRLTGAEVIYDAHEDLSLDILSKRYLAPRIRPAAARGLALVEQFICRYFSAVVVASPAQYPRLAHANRRTLSIRNLADLDGLGLSERPGPWLQRQPWVVYAGLLSVDRGVREMIAAMALLPEACTARLQLAGRFEPGLQAQLACAPGWQRVDLHGHVDRPALGRLLGQARVGMLVQHATDAFQAAWPTKLFEYMAAGVPTVVSDMRLHHDLIGMANCAVFVDPHNPAAIAGALQYLLAHDAEAEAMGLRARDAVAERYSWAGEERKLLDCYADVVGPSTRGDGGARRH